MHALIPHRYLVLIGFTLLLFSFIGFLYPWLNTTIFFVLVVGIALGTYIKLEFGVLAALFELILGGHGYLFSFTVFGFTCSLRIAIFAILMIAYLFFLLRHKQLPRFFTTKLSKPLLLFMVVIILGIMLGIVRNDLKIVFHDANAYIAILYIPIFVEAIKTKIHVHRLLRVLSSGVFVLSVVTIALLGIYALFHYDASLQGASTVTDQTHEQIASLTIDGDGAPIGQRVGFSSSYAELHYGDATKTKPETYRWLRDTGTAQISYISNHFFRVFFPSHVYVLLFFFVLLWSIFVKPKLWLSAYGLLLGITLFISYSRSIWLGLAIGLFLFSLQRFLASKKKFLLTCIVLCLCSGILVLFFTSSAPTVVTERIQSILNPSSEVAGTHRIELGKAILEHVQRFPIFGTGFGSLLTFPTVLPNGEVVATSFYIFEWAYGDVLVKTGALGLFAFFYLVIQILRQKRGVQQKQQQIVFRGLKFGVLALLITNITTPVFTHPLGFGLLAIAASLFYATYESSDTNSYLEQ